MINAPDNAWDTKAKRDRKSRASTGLMRACGAVGGVDLGLKVAQVDRVHTIHNIDEKS